MTDTEPLDLDAVYDRWIDWYNGAPNPYRWRHRDADESMSHCLAREDVPALIAEVRRLREECDAAYEAVAGSPEKGKRIASIVRSATRLVQIERDDARAALDALRSNR